MSGIAVITYLVAAAPGVTAIAPAASIYGGAIEMGAQLPALAVSQVSGIYRNTVSMAESRRMVTDRVRVTAHGAYDDVKALIEAVRRACPVKPIVSTTGVDLDSILPDVVGPDLFYEDTKVHEQSIDFIVKWRTA